MKQPTSLKIAMLAGLFGLGASTCMTHAQKSVVQPGDPVIASSSNSPGSEGVANVVDGTQAKYLNFDLANDAKPAGFVVTPSIGPTVINGLAMESANDSPDRDPLSITVEGSNDDTVDWTTGTWTLIYKNDKIPAWTDLFGTTNRFQVQTFSFDNVIPYKHYRWTTIHTQGTAPGTPSTCCMQIAEVQFLGAAAPKNVVQPGDLVTASSSNSPGSEGVANVIDGTQAKYLNFDLANDAKPAGFVVTPSLGATVITGLAMESANDSPDRDPLSVTVEGSNDDTVDWTTGTWTLIYKNDKIPAWTDLFGTTNRFQTQSFFFANVFPYKHYRWTVLHTQGTAPGTPSTCCMQIAEVQLLGTSAPKNVVQPGDQITASSSNSPGSEGVANAVDGTQAKYLNFDLANDAKPAGFVVTPSVGATVVTGLGLESANDSPDRDPLSVTVEGSNDDAPDWTTGTWTLIYKNDKIPAWTDLFGTTNRFQWQYFYFTNSLSFKHYRWTTIHTQGTAPGTPSTCCMQIAEVQLLAITSQVDCNKAAFVVQPVDTSVLSGNPATFFVTVNGPWPLQWYKGTNAIPGATGTSYTTDPITSTNSSDTYSVRIVGCEESTPVKTVLFTPSTTKSVGIHFGGGGANGAPTYVLDTDIMGIQPQAHWNNITNNAGGAGTTGDTTTEPDSLVDSTGSNTTISFEFATTGAWGAGTGVDQPTQRLLNGIAGNNAPGTVGTFTFHNVPAGSHSVIVYSVSPPLQFQVNRFTIGTTSYYMRSLSSDEYKGTPGFYRALSTDTNKPAIGDFVRFDNVQPVGGDINLEVECLTPGFDRQTGVNALQLLLDAPSPGAPPTITQDPQSTVGPTNGTVTLSVKATGDNLTYQWRRNDFGNASAKTLPNGGGISGATSSTLTISGLSADDEGVYSVAVFNPAGSVISRNAAVHVSQFNIQDALAGYWKFDETSGTSAANAVSGGKPVALTGTVTWGKGQVTNAVTLDGASYGKVDDYTKATTAISGSAWVNAAAGASANEVIFRNAQGDLIPHGGAVAGVTFGQFELRLVLDANTGGLTPEVAIQIGPNVSRVASPTPITTGAWHQLAFSADGAQLTLYVDGAPAAVVDYLANITKPDISYLTVGVEFNLADATDPTSALGPDAANPGFFAGSIDELALWDRALTADEVSKIYAAEKAGAALTSVTETPPVSNTPTLAVARTSTGLTLTFTGTLQSADAITGPWTDVTGGSPQSVTFAGAAKFYRAKQ